jgi:hypothetical protein
MKQPQLFTVRNASGQFLGTYRAQTSAQANQRLKDEQATYCSTFRRSGTRVSFEGCTAAAEPTLVGENQ